MDRKKIYIYRHEKIGNNKIWKMASNLIEIATPSLLFFYLSKPLNEEESWIRPWLRTIFLNYIFALKGVKN